MSDATKPTPAAQLWASLKHYFSLRLAAELRARDAKVAELERRLGQIEQKDITTERRLSRHSEHLANLENKLQRLK